LSLLYVKGIARNRVDLEKLDDVTSYVILEAVKGYPNLLIKDSHNDASVYSKWLYNMTVRKIRTYHRLDRSRLEVPASQLLGLDQDDNEETSDAFFDCLDFATREANGTLLADTEEDKEERDLFVNGKLDGFRDELSERDQTIFDCWRRGMNRYEISRELGVTASLAHSRLLSWRRMTATAERKAQFGKKWRKQRER
jgi:hypothetical protein